MSVDVVTGELVPVKAELLTAAPTADVVALQRQFHDLCVALLDAGDYQRIGAKDFKKKSAWRKLAAAFNVSDNLLERTYERDSETGRIIRAEYVVEATAPNGRHTVGIGISSIHERGFSNPEHDIPATAHTRAKNRAFADLFGLGEVSAEEVTEDWSSRRPRADKGKARQGRSKAAAEPTPEPPAPEPEVSPEVQALEDRLRKLNLKHRGEFRDWRRSRGLDWPPANADVVRLMEAEVSVIEARGAEEHESYYSPGAGSPFD